MASMEEDRVKNEPICYSQSISQTKRAKKVKEEPIDNDMQTSKSKSRRKVLGNGQKNSPIKQ